MKSSQRGLSSALVTQTNISRMEAQRNLNRNQRNLSKSVGRLSSGFRINSAADDAVGLGISEGMKANIGS